MYTITRKPLSFFGLVLPRSIFHVHQNGQRLSTVPTRREALLYISMKSNSTWLTTTWNPAAPRSIFPNHQAPGKGSQQETLIMNGKETGIDGNCPAWPGASALYSWAYDHMKKYGPDYSLIEALQEGNEERLKTLKMLRIQYY